MSDPIGPDAPMVLSARLRAATVEPHRRAERAGAMAALLRGELDAWRYLVLLRALHAIYSALEPALHRHRLHPTIAPLALEPLARADALATDIRAFGGATGVALPARSDARATTIAHAPAADGLPAEARRYAEHLATLDASSPALLVAHAYVRYLGDLSGGQLLAPIVERAYRLAPGEATRFYDFGGIAAARTHAATLRHGLDAIALPPDLADAIVAEACDAFERHVRLFEAIAAG